jgi:threonine aldolase
MAFPDGIADFRSDTVTRPTPEMRRALAAAEVGDDVYGEDPTVNALEEEAAAAVGKEAGLFVPSGSMANLIAVSLHTNPGDDVVCDEWAHVRNYESGAGPAVSGVGFRIVPRAGRVTAADVERVVAESRNYLPPVTLLVMENTHNVSGGRVVPIDLMADTAAMARDLGLRIHLDGARLFNAAVASGVPAARFADQADTVMFCFSKRLGAPVGSILCGDGALISHARRLRKRHGGGMRQVGVVAAAARVALRRVDELAADHVLAADLAAALAARFPAAVDPATVETNMVVVNEAGMPFPATVLQEGLAASGIRVGFIGPGMLRFCTHHDVDAADVARVAAVVDELREAAPGSQSRH